MNLREKEMIDILKKGKDEFGVVATKAEFEAEGTRMDELLKLIDISNIAGLDVTLKIGGCEALRDLIEARQFGVKYIVAPMVETAYALRKYIVAKDTVFKGEQDSYTVFLFNLETITAFNNIEDMVKVAVKDKSLDGMVFGRVDFSNSLGLERKNIEDSLITEYAIKASKIAKENNLQFVLGGSISSDAMDNVKALKNSHLDRFETRKIVFKSSCLDNCEINSALESAIYFELLWLLNKQEYHDNIRIEDQTRINMLKARLSSLS